MKIGIAGAGLLGRLLALRCLQQQWQVTLFDQDNRSGERSCGYMAAGMISPIAELMTAEPWIYQAGKNTWKYWAEVIKNLNKPVFWQNSGTILTAHRQDQSELEYFLESVLRKTKNSSLVQLLTEQQCIELEPELRLVNNFYYLPLEGQISSQELFVALESTLLDLGVIWHENSKVVDLSAATIILENNRYYFDWVFDCRGLGAKGSLKNLRGIRGELIWLHAPDVYFKRPIRLMHPRFSLYIVPRPNQIYILGASEIESEDMSSISVRTTLELLTAAYSLHRGFSEGRILRTEVNCRPTFPDHLPKIYFTHQLVRINGLYRYGYLLAPLLVDEVICFLLKGLDKLSYPNLFQEI